MASSMNLLGTEVHEVQEEWSGWQELKATNKTAKASQRDVHFFRLVAPTESSKITGLEGTHLPKALWQHSGLSFCLWCGKEGQNEGMVVNHLWTMHYHLGLICTCCLDFFTTRSDTMWQHALVCKSMAASDSNGNREESSRGRWQKVMMTSYSDMMRTRKPCPLHVTSHHCQLNPPLWCPHQGRSFLLRPSSSLNYSSFHQCRYLLMTHYIHLCSKVHYIQASYHNCSVLVCVPLQPPAMW